MLILFNISEKQGDAITHAGNVKCSYDGKIEEYHFASMSEWCGIISGQIKTNSSQGYYQNVYDHPETVLNDTATVHGDKLKFTSYYKKVRNIAYAIRFIDETQQGYGNAYRCAYMYEYDSSIKCQKISCKYLGNVSTTIDDVATSEFWADNTGTIIRYFRDSGTIKNGEGTGSAVNVNPTFVYYWTEKVASSASYNWCVWASSTSFFQFYTNAVANEAVVNGMAVRLFKDN